MMHHESKNILIFLKIFGFLLDLDRLQITFIVSLLIVHCKELQCVLFMSIFNVYIRTGNVYFFQCHV